MRKFLKFSFFLGLPALAYDEYNERYWKIKNILVRLLEGTLTQSDVD